VSSVNFTSVLCAAFTLVDPKSIKKIDGLTVFFALLGSLRITLDANPTKSLFIFPIFSVKLECLKHN